MIRTTYNPARGARKATAKATRRAIQRALVGATARFLRTGALVTITTALGQLGADDELLRRYASHAGKKVKAAYLAITGNLPVQVWTARNGHPTRVYAYPANDLALTAGFAAYQRTAHLVAA